MSKHPEQFTVEAWSANAIAFIEDQGLTREFSDWCGGWPCPVDPKLVTAAPELLEALIVLTELSHMRMPGGYGHVIDQARAAIAKARGSA